jgi:SAM-dependent methyltransferase
MSAPKMSSNARETAAPERSRDRRFVVAHGALDHGVVVGNHYDKYGSRNPIVRRLMRGFADALEELVAMTAVREVHEVGCGEGFWTLRWAARGLSVRGSDFSEHVIRVARENGARAASAATFRAASVYELQTPRDAAPLVVCCEVLEHLEQPRLALERLAAVATPWLIASVPREPIWRALNMARGRYWRDLGNTPGHLQHWSKRQFVELLSEQLDVVAVRSPLPWTMALCRRRPWP